MNTTLSSTGPKAISAGRKFYNENKSDFVSLHQVALLFADGKEVYANTELGCCFTSATLKKQLCSSVQPENIYIYKLDSSTPFNIGYKAFVTIDNPTTFKEVIINESIHIIYMDVELDILKQLSEDTKLPEYDISSASTTSSQTISSVDSVSSLKDESIKKMKEQEQYLDVEMTCKKRLFKGTGKLPKSKYQQKKTVTNFTKSYKKEVLSMKQHQKHAKKELISEQKTKMFSSSPDYAEFIKHGDTFCKSCKNTIDGEFHFYRKEKQLYCLFEQGCGPLCYECLEDAIDHYSEYLYNERLYDDTYDKIEASYGYDGYDPNWFI